MENFDIIKILSYGLSGLSFLLLFMTYSLIVKEQKRPRPRKEILGTIKFFMTLVFLCIVTVGIFGVPAIRDNELLKDNNDALRFDKLKVFTLNEIKEDNEYLEKNVQNLNQDQIAEIMEKNVQKLDTLAKKAPQEQNQEIQQIKQNLREQAERIDKKAKPLTRRKADNVIEDVRNINQEIDKVMDKDLKKDALRLPK